jgi:hypothetical protein
VLNPNQIVRRYTPPTCTLEIQGKSSLLSRWKGSNIVRNLWFQLSFGDRQLPEVARVKICGDRFQLEELCEIVGEYVQQFLSQTSWNTKPVAIDSSPTKIDKPYLKQKGLLDHELYFGSIAGKKERKIIKLTSTQLFDLANVLDEFARDITLLPAEKELPTAVASLESVDSTPKITPKTDNNRKKKQNRGKLPSWTVTAASFLFASGITFAGMRFYYQSQSNSSVALNKTSENPKSIPTPTTEANKGDSVPPPPTIATIPIPSNSLPPSLSTQNTPPPPTATQTPATQRQTDLNSNNNSTSPENSSNKYSTPPNVTTNPKTGSNSNRQKNDDRRRDIDPIANSKTQSSSNNSNSDNTDNNKNELAIVTTDTIPELPPSEANTTTKPDTAQETDLSQKTYPGYTPNSSNSGTIAETPPVDGNNFRLANPAVVTSTTQVEQVQQYFKTRWQPPTDLKETLQYNLSISNSGSLLSISPVGKTSATYLDRTNMPLLNESFVSPSNGGGSTKIRLVLNPDGTVQTFQD